MRIAAPVELSPEQRTVLERLARQRSLPARLMERAQIVLRAAEGMENQQIARLMGMTPEKAARWRKRFLEGGWMPSRRTLHVRAEPAASQIAG